MAEAQLEGFFGVGISVVLSHDDLLVLLASFALPSFQSLRRGSRDPIRESTTRFFNFAIKRKTLALSLLFFQCNIRSS